MRKSDLIFSIPQDNKSFRRKIRSSIKTDRTTICRITHHYRMREVHGVGTVVIDSDTVLESGVRMEIEGPCFTPHYQQYSYDTESIWYDDTKEKSFLNISILYRLILQFCLHRYIQTIYPVMQRQHWSDMMLLLDLVWMQWKKGCWQGLGGRRNQRG